MAGLLAVVGLVLYNELGRSLTRSLDQGLRGRAQVIAALAGPSDSGLREAPPTGGPETNVADHGQGFVRGAPIRHEPAGAPRGGGFGLAIVAAIAESHDGALRLEAGAGGGALATLVLPKRRGA